MDEKFMEETKKKKRQTILKEQKELLLRQKDLRDRKIYLQERKEALRDKLYSPDLEEKKIEQIRTMLGEIDKDIKEINEEYKMNSEALEFYSRVVKNKDDGKCSIIGTLFTGLGTGAAVYLGKKSLDNAYKSDVEGTLVNKKTLDVFNRLNPLKMIQHFRK